MQRNGLNVSLTTLIILLALAALVMPAAASEEATITRTITSTAVFPGDTYNVTLTIHYNIDEDIIAIHEDLPDDWVLNEIDSGRYEWSPSQQDWVFMDMIDTNLTGVTDIITYSVTVPAEVETYEYGLSYIAGGYVDEYYAWMVNTTGDTEVSVVHNPIVELYPGDDFVAAMNSAQEGDTVLLNDGVYNCDDGIVKCNYVTLKSKNGSAAVTIQVDGDLCIGEVGDWSEIYAKGNTFDGITFNGSVAPCLDAVEDTVFRNCTFAASFQDNTVLMIWSDPADNVSIYQCNFYGNIEDGEDVVFNTTDPVTYTYRGETYTGYLGNYYDYFTGTDTDGDGVFDSANGDDRYPLVGPWNKDKIIPVPPVAEFAADTTSGYAPLTVNFTDNSTGAESWSWDFNNDGVEDSTEQSPSYIYNTAGVYTVNLTVTNPGGSDSEIKTGYITVNAPPEPPVAEFAADTTSGYAPLTVNFTDNSADADSWSWDFNNDGVEDSTEQSPSYIYNTAGVYTVNLTVTNPGGSDSEIKTGYITVNTPPVPPVTNFTADSRSGVAPLIVQFTDLSEHATEWAWDFNNDSVVDSTEQNPTYTYNTAGVYTVNLTVTNNDGSDSEIKTDYITVEEFVPEEVNSSVSIGDTAEINDTTKEIAINTSSDKVEIIDNTTIKIKNKNLDLYIHTDETGFKTEGNKSKGNYTEATVDKKAEVSNLGGNLNNVSTAFNATLTDNLSSLLQGNASIKTRVVRELDNDTSKAFQSAAGEFAKEMHIAYSLEIEKQNLDGISVKDAYITMTAPESYVNSSGGAEHFVVMSLHDGQVTKLKTTYTIERNFYIFTAYSPEGFSTKSLVYYTPKVPSGSNSGGSGGGTGSATVISKETTQVSTPDDNQPSEVINKPSSETDATVVPDRETEGNDQNTPEADNEENRIPGFTAHLAILGLLSALYMRKK